MSEIVRSVWPDSEWLERVLRDEAAVLTHDHDGRDGRLFSGVAVHRRLHLDPRELADSPLAVSATRTSSRATGFQGSDDSMLVVS